MKVLLSILICLLALIPRLTYAQSYKKGFIIKGDKDTIHGYIEDKTDTGLDTVISFSNTGGKGQEVKFTAKDLSGFGFLNGRIFERMIFKDSVNDTIRVFAKKLIEGKIRVFRTARIIL